MENKDRELREALVGMMERVEADLTRWSELLEKAITVGIEDDSELREHGLIQLYDPKTKKEVSPDDYDPDGKGHQWFATRMGIELMLAHNPDVLYDSPYLTKKFKRQIKNFQRYLVSLEGVN